MQRRLSGEGARASPAEVGAGVRVRAGAGAGAGLYPVATVSHASAGRTQGWRHMRGHVLGGREGIKFAGPGGPARRKCRPASEARDTGAPGRERVLEGGGLTHTCASTQSHPTLHA